MDLLDFLFVSFALNYGSRPANPFFGMTKMEDSAQELAVFADKGKRHKLTPKKKPLVRFQPFVTPSATPQHSQKPTIAPPIVLNATSKGLIFIVG